MNPSVVRWVSNFPLARNWERRVSEIANWLSANCAKEVDGPWTGQKPDRPIKAAAKKRRSGATATDTHTHTHPHVYIYIDQYSYMCLFCLNLHQGSGLSKSFPKPTLESRLCLGLGCRFQELVSCTLQPDFAPDGWEEVIEEEAARLEGDGGGGWGRGWGGARVGRGWGGGGGGMGGMPKSLVNKCKTSGVWLSDFLRDFLGPLLFSVFVAWRWKPPHGRA